MAGKVKEFTETNFEENVVKNSQPVLVDFWAPWCGPCHQITPILEELSEEVDGKAVIGKVNVDDNPDLAARFGIRSIPTLLVFKNGEMVDKQVGVTDKSTLKEKLGV
ncbi:MAG: thioredoxin [Verrucomicrobiota bacterium]